jgi:hypothetical protein
MPGERRRRVFHAVYSMHVVLDGHGQQIDAHLVASTCPAWIEAFCGFELVRVKGGI